MDHLFRCEIITEIVKANVIPINPEIFVTKEKIEISCVVNPYLSIFRIVFSTPFSEIIFNILMLYKPDNVLEEKIKNSVAIK
jgi:hypothetical protein